MLLCSRQKTYLPVNHSRRISNRAKLIAALWLLLSAGFLATTLVSYFNSRASIRDSIILTELPLTSDNVYSEIQKDLVRPVLISSTMAHDTFLRDWVLRGEQDVAGGGQPAAPREGRAVHRAHDGLGEGDQCLVEGPEPT